MNNKKICIDIDGTICTNTWGDYESAQPFAERINFVNQLFDSGAYIIFFTARGSGTGIDWKSFTLNQLESWGVKFNELILGKPEAEVYVDDRAISDENFFYSVTFKE